MPQPYDYTCYECGEACAGAYHIDKKMMCYWCFDAFMLEKSGKKWR